MRDALNKTGRPIYFSLCGWNAWYAPVGWSLGNSWRIHGDVNTWGSAYAAIRTNELLYNYSRPGGWNDPDMLVGSSPEAAAHMSPQQSRTQFSLWSVMAAPLLIGSNMLNISSYDVETYTNREVIAIDQDPLGYQGRPVYSTCPPPSLDDINNPNAIIPPCQQIWAKKMADGSVAVNMINYALAKTTITCHADCIKAMGLSGKVSVRDVWQHKDMGTFTSYSAAVGGNGNSATLIFKQA
ncbi:hypothetical protein PTSG_06551 [Salpingoeca rosetta]|uniref:alpha-galactosidase n=1 Tax=Salpingoeca rosetta (strain ATCC 50818 / BSB-021) TaxID=946362 RepID=F2UG49_SALR5|nr:uncharacterized protein PTSG_06551 [Salpingoeca rosetta]EGD75477.1 hypothetical protein PTSG_06551 [Salpingoeca rosetta]|eukprot:XP_004991934.1 hypothetical protein PTSG_06551 [Salpingoeca rosetta]